MGLGKWLEMTGHAVGDVALKASGKSTTASEASKKKEAPLGSGKASEAREKTKSYYGSQSEAIKKATE